MHNLFPDIPDSQAGGANTPFGEAKDDIVPGDFTGTKWVKKGLNDLYYGFYALIFKAGISPSGNTENVSTSDVADAVIALIAQNESPNFFNPTPQLVPNNTVLLGRSVVRDPDDDVSEPVIVAVGAADALTVAGVATVGESRIDRWEFDQAGVVYKLTGVEAITPVKPTLTSGRGPICRVLVNTVGGAAVIDNATDIITDERIINRLQKSDEAASGIGKVVLQGRVNAVGTKNLERAFGSGATFTVNKAATGIYDITLSGISGTNVEIAIGIHGSNTGRFHKSVPTDKLSATGWGTPAGFRIITSIQVAATAVDTDTDFSFTVRRLD